jgi:hypothetical protein
MADLDYRTLPLRAQRRLLEAHDASGLNFVDGWAIDVLYATNSRELGNKLGLLGAEVAKALREEGERWGFTKEVADVERRRIYEESAKEESASEGWRIKRP